MGKCSYTWEEWDSKKGKSVEKQCSRETWEGSDEYCIFHDPSPDKDVDLFKENLEEQLQSETDRYYFVGYFFPEGGCNFKNQEFTIDADFREATLQDADFGGATFQGTAGFEEAKFRGFTHFGGATFQGTADFREATFQNANFNETTFQDANFNETTFQDAYFNETTFQGTAYFWRATFQGTAYFWRATFQGTADFRRATFQDANFGEATFQGTADFRRATFQDAYFWRATFQGTADFRRATFQGTADFRRATFQGTADFREATFQDANFNETTFQNAYFNETTFQDAYFWRATFQGTADFRRATFQGTADFGETTFQNAYFNETTFQGTADFRGATFQDANFGEATFQNANFREATFQDANFWRATFQGTADFRRATFQGTADFRGATFQGTADFRGATFQDADFRGATFQNANFWGATIEKTFEFAPAKYKVLDLRDAKFLFRANITANMTSAKFHRAYLDNVAFIDCIWPGKIFEEVHMEDEDIKISYNQLETIYRDLKQNMQNHGDYDTAGKFYYREMEMRRKGSTSWKNRIWLNIYRIVGGYGEGPLNTAAVSGFIIILFALAYGISGCLQYTVQNPCLSQQIKDSIYFSFVTFTTLGLGDISPANDLGKFLICCEAVIGAFLIALFVVVFARKMMR
jgi:uncharacterized protein YjbI with pentapeptide repeats